MLKSNLSVLLAERNLKITKVSNDTGISRTTLTALCYGAAKGVQFDTLNTLCIYLRTQPDKLFAFTPVDIELDQSFKFDEDGSLEITVKTRNDIYHCSLDVTIQVEKLSYLSNTIGEDDDYIRNVDIFLNLPYEDPAERDGFNLSANSILLEAFHTISLPFLTDIENEICERVCSDLQISEESGIDIHWMDGLTSEI